jgi:predicted porin
MQRACHVFDGCHGFVVKCLFQYTQLPKWRLAVRPTAPFLTLENLEMKKTLVALAALASVSAFAQSSVTITGFVDRGLLITNNTANSTSSAKSIASNSGTTRLEFAGTEDLGGGLKAGFFVETDWNTLGGTTTTANNANSPQTGSFANSESYFKVETSAGTLKLGAPNNDTFVTAMAVQPAFSTGVGSLYSSNFSIHNGAGTGNTAGTGGQLTWVADSAKGAGARSIRQDHTIKFNTVSYNGLVAGIAIAPKNSYTKADGTAATAGNAGATDLSLRYTQGALDLAYSHMAYKVGSDLVAAATAPTTNPYTDVQTNLAGQTLTNQIFGGSYTLGAAKLFAGTGSSKSTDGLAVNSSSRNVGIQYNMGQIDLMAQYAKVDDKRSADFDRTLTGLGANYNFSKQTYAYFRYDSINYDKNHAASAGSEQKRTAVGFAYKF